jgi:hypothetical protein
MNASDMLANLDEPFLAAPPVIPSQPRGNERRTLPPPLHGQGILFTVKQEWKRPVGDELDVAFSDAAALYETHTYAGEHVVEACLPIERDPECPGMLLAWHFMMCVYDPFQDASSSHLDRYVDKLLES